MTLDVSDDPAGHAAAHILTNIRATLSPDRPFHLAVSGGQTPYPLFRALAAAGLDWSRVHVWQVDERVAPAGDSARNLTLLRQGLDVPAVFHRIPVEHPDAADRYARELEQACGGVLDLVHLGLGDDGHTASLIPGDPVLNVFDVDVATTGPYEGHRRVTLTIPALERSRYAVWLVTGASKSAALARLLAHDRTIPAGRLRLAHSMIYADPAAAGRLG